MIPNTTPFPDKIPSFNYFWEHIERYDTEKNLLNEDGMYHSERILETYNKINQLISKFLKGEKIYRLIAITKKSLEKIIKGNSPIGTSWTLDLEMARICNDEGEKNLFVTFVAEYRESKKQNLIDYEHTFGQNLKWDLWESEISLNEKASLYISHIAVYNSKEDSEQIFKINRFLRI
ncbi:MAG: hypothetical protein ACTSVL_06370 [Promethearchaeota archaeon]